MYKLFRSYRAFAGVLAALMLVGVGASQVSALKLNLGSVLKVGGIGFLVTKFAPQIDSAINSVFGKKFAPYEATKVVPIVSIGSGTSIGAAQVQGSPEAIAKVKGVAQLEVKFLNQQFRINALVPVDDLNPTKMSRVKGVGVSAVIDVKV